MKLLPWLTSTQVDDAADHQELAVGEVDDAGQAEDQRDADPDQDDDARHRQAVDELLEKDVHRSALTRQVGGFRGIRSRDTRGPRSWEAASSRLLAGPARKPSPAEAESAASIARGGSAGGCSTAHSNWSEVFGLTRQTSVANVTW